MGQRKKKKRRAGEGKKEIERRETEKQKGYTHHIHTRHIAPAFGRHGNSKATRSTTGRQTTDRRQTKHGPPTNDPLLGTFARPSHFTVRAVVAQLLRSPALLFLFFLLHPRSSAPVVAARVHGQLCRGASCRSFISQQQKSFQCCFVLLEDVVFLLLNWIESQPSLGEKPGRPCSCGLPSPCP